MLGHTGRVPLRRVGGGGWVWFTVLVTGMLLVVLAPVAMLLVNTFQLGTIGQYAGWGLDSWRHALSDPRVPAAVGNTLSLSAIRQAIAIVIGVLVAYLIARTDLPGGRWLEFGFWIAVFMPSLTVTLSWIFMLDPVNGVANRTLMALPFIDEPVFDIFSYWGIVWVHVMSGTLAVKVMLLTPAFRAMDSSLEEAARASGDTVFGTFRRITLPILMPVFLVVLVLGFIRSFEAFEVEQILGTPARIEVLSSLIYNLARNESPPLYGPATVVSMLAVLIMLPAIIFQQRYGERRSVSTVTGRFRNQPRALGAWRWPAFALVLVLVLLMTVIPAVALVTGTFMKIFGVFGIPEPWTLAHWATALDSPIFTRATINSISLSLVTTLVAVVLFSTISYLIVRTRFRGRGLLDFLAWMPSIIPGIVLGLGYLWVFLNTPVLEETYGTIWILVIVAALGSMTLTVQMVKSSLRQLGSELEEASAASGASKLQTIGLIVVPLLAPTLVVVAVTAFSATARTTSHVALLATSRNQPLSILQLNQMADNAYGPASVIGVLLLLMTVGVALLARMFGYRDY